MAAIFQIALSIAKFKLCFTQYANLTAAPQQIHYI